MMKKTISLLLAVLIVLSVMPAMALSRDFGSVKISEFMASNGDTLEDSFGEDPDWIELYNDSDEDIDLEGLCLSDGKRTLDKFVFPAGAVLPARGYLVIFASGLDTTTTNDDGETEYHTRFKLSASGEKVVISYQDVILDMVKFEQQEKDVSYALKDDGSWDFCHTPTPGAANVFD